MEKRNNTTLLLPEAISTEILARLPLRTISRFKSVCKPWKSPLESVYFRRLFVSLHGNSSSSWSIMWNDKELINFHGCKTWGLPKFLASYISDLQTCTDSCSNGLVLIRGMSESDDGFFVGNPVLQQWVKIPSFHIRTTRREVGLVTRVDEDGVALGFKVVRLIFSSPTCFLVCLYSSETGIWTCKLFPCPNSIYKRRPMTVNGTVYFLCKTDSDSNKVGPLIALDVYSESEECRVIPLPDSSNHNSQEKCQRALTTSGGSVVYMKVSVENAEENLKVWKLINGSRDGDEPWRSLGEIRLPDIGNYAPMAMHPFDSDIVYIWSHQKRHLVSCNLRTQNYRVLSDDYFVNQSLCQEYMDTIPCSETYVVTLSPFVLPQWMESVPCPPQLEIIDTASLLSMQNTKNDKGK